MVEAVLAQAEGISPLVPAEIVSGLASLLPEEMPRIAAATVSQAGLQSLRTLPGTQPCDGFYVAVLERRS